MIARLKGLVDAVGTDTAVIDVNGVGYLVHASSRTLAQMGQGDAVALFIETHVREDHIHLYGFLRADEQDWFRLLTTVQGVGAKVALAMLSALTGDMLLQAIAAGDKAAICRAPGVGPKLAQRILHELKDKVGALALGPVAAKGGVAPAPGAAKPDIAGDAAQDLLRDAASALVNLGYTPSEALGAVSRAAQASDVALTLEALIRAGLAELAPSDQRRGA
ncbi:MAG TPA: Holliday junction branch migration protein RuvA [Rhodospirillaceae bacterium]|nr:Holliday junction branch migration protein RuvA [Rhodospirillaceae bacterium]|tara:strand:- start:31 stop:690 length:660 start_codon:yes stop_codon:yes gene_type:complete